MIEVNRLDLSEKQKNVMKVLGAIIDEQKAQTTDIKKKTNLSVSTISRVITHLKQKKLLEITGKEKTAKGRYPLILRFNFDYGHIVHLNITPKGIAGCLANLSGEIISKERIDLSAGELTLDILRLSISEIYSRLTRNKSVRVLAAGISLPGVVDTDKRIVSRIPDIFAFNNVDVFSLAEKSLKVPVIINNVPGVAAVGERIMNYPDCSDLVYLNIVQNIGIGAGIVVNGRLLKGKDYIAGEVGDFYFDRESFSAGHQGESIGRLEEYAGLGSLYSRAQSLISSGGAENLKRIMLEEGSDIDLGLIERSIDEGDTDLEAEYLDVIRVWVILLINIILLLNPQIIVAGGAVGAENKKTESVINEMIEKELFVKQRIIFSAEGDNAVFAGGLQMLKSYVFNEIIACIATDLR